MSIHEGGAQSSDSISGARGRTMVTLKARPVDVEIDINRTAVIVVDMQNAYASKGGMLDSERALTRPVSDPSLKQTRSCCPPPAGRASR